MTEDNRDQVRRQLRSPRAAAVAGIVFSVLLMTTMVLFSSMALPAEFNRAWLQTWSRTSRVALALVPFAGYALLYFTGVIRDRLGDREDRFFATLFFGSGLILVVLLYIWAATMGAIFGTFALTTYQAGESYIFFFGSAFMNEIIGNYTVRMAGLYMLSIATLWIRTGAMPRWLIIITYIVALGFIFSVQHIRAARYIFPAWVFFVSTFILISDYRPPPSLESEHQRADHDWEKAASQTMVKIWSRL